MTVSTSNARNRVGKGLFVIGCAFALGLTSAPFALAEEANPGEESSADGTILNVSVSEDGAITSIGSGVDTGQVYDPSMAAQDLPVRVLTSWTADGKSGSDLRKVAGASGKVQVDLSLQNVTGKIENVSVDANGQSVSSAQLVATPLTVVASTRLEGVAPEQVITDEDSATGYTNGVVSVIDEVTVVQWATILAPPVLDGDVTFSLVADADNFTLPEIDIAVAPGFGLNALKQSGTEADVVAQTISTLSDVGVVLAESGEALTDARVMLSDAGNQIGSRTISDLTASNDRILASTEGLSQTLTALDQSLTGELSASGEAIASELATTTQTVYRLLGNPDASAPEINVNPYTCDIEKIGGDGKTDAQVKDEQQRRLEQSIARNGVYGVISELSVRLDAYADASAACQAEISSDLDRLLGPAEPDEEVCANSDSLSCGLWQTRSDLVEVSRDLADQGVQISNLLEQEPVADSYEAAVQLGEAITDLNEKIGVLEKEQPGINFNRYIRSIQTSLRDTTRDLTNLKRVLDDVHRDLSSALQTSDQQLEKIHAMKMEVCIASGQTIPEGEEAPLDPQIDRAMADQLLDTLATHGCPSAFDTDDGWPLIRGRNSVQGLENAQRANIEAAVARTAPYVEEGDNSDLANAVKNMEDSIVEVEEAVQALVDAKNADNEALDTQIKDVKEAFTEVNRLYGDAYKLLDEMNSSYIDTQAEVAKTFDETANKLSQDATENYESSLNGVNDVRGNSKKKSGEFFGKIGEDLKATSKEMRDSSGKAIRSTEEEVERLNTTLGEGTRESLNVSSQRMHEVLSSAIVDSDAAGELLSADIQNVLNDIGTNDADSTGLLGAMAASNGQIAIADEKMTDSTTHMSQYQLLQRSRLDEYILRQGVLQASLARLETVPGFPIAQPDINPDVFTFHVRTGEDK